MPETGSRLASLADLIAMKLSAIVDAGTRIKDFVDISFLSTRFSLKEMQGFYVARFSNANPLLPAKALLYHEDIQLSEPVQLIGGTFSWEKTAHRLRDMVARPEEVFASSPDAA